MNVALLFRPFPLDGARCSQPLSFHGRINVDLPHRPVTGAGFRSPWGQTGPVACVDLQYFSSCNKASPSQPTDEPGNPPQLPTTVVPVPCYVLIGCTSLSVVTWITLICSKASLLLESIDQQIWITADLGESSCRNLELLSGTFIDFVWLCSSAYAGGLWSVFTLGGAASKAGLEEEREPLPLSNQSLLLLLVLANLTDGPDWPNPYRQAIACFRNTQGECGNCLHQV